MENNKDSGVHTDIIRYTETLASNPANAVKAIKSRNLIIKSLKAEIEHRKIADKEIEERMDLLVEERDTLKRLNKSLSDTLAKELDKNNLLTSEKEKLKIYINEFENELIKVRTEIETVEKLKKDSWSNKVKELVNKIPKWSVVGPILGFLLTPPTSKYTLLFVFVILLIASFIGWPGVAAKISPIIKLFWS